MTNQSQATPESDQPPEERVRAKFEAFYERLPADEQQALDTGIGRALTGAAGDDISGHGFGTSPIRILDRWTVRAAYISPGSRMDQEMDHGISRKAASGEHFPEVTI